MQACKNSPKAALSLFCRFCKDEAPRIHVQAQCSPETNMQQMIHLKLGSRSGNKQKVIITRGSRGKEKQVKRVKAITMEGKPEGAPTKTRGGGKHLYTKTANLTKKQQEEKMVKPRAELNI